MAEVGIITIWDEMEDAVARVKDRLSWFDWVTAEEVAEVEATDVVIQAKRLTKAIQKVLDRLEI